MDWRVILFYFAAAIAVAQTINGVVISSTDHQPIRKATVTLRHTQKSAAYVATSDAAGQFRFEAVEPGKYVVVAERQGYFMPPRTVVLTVAEQQQVRDARVELIPFGVIRGRVLDSDGEPVIAAQVRAAHFTYD